LDFGVSLFVVYSFGLFFGRFRGTTAGLAVLGTCTPFLRSDPDTRFAVFLVPGGPGFDVLHVVLERKAKEERLCLACEIHVRPFHQFLFSST